MIFLTAAADITLFTAGYRLTAIYCALRLTFALPISTIVFSISMVISNAFGAGVELAEFSTLIPKVLLLVLLANLAGLVSFVGWLMALVVFFIGSMIFFELEAWETRFLVIINWGLNWVAWIFLIGILISLVTPAPKDVEKGGDRPKDKPPAMQQDNNRDQ